MAFHSGGMPVTSPEPGLVLSTSLPLIPVTFLRTTEQVFADGFSWLCPTCACHASRGQRSPWSAVRALLTAPCSRARPVAPISGLPFVFSQTSLEFSLLFSFRLPQVHSQVTSVALFPLLKIDTFEFPCVVFSLAVSSKHFLITITISTVSISN